VAGLFPDDLTDCFGFRFTIGEYTQTAACFRERINCGAILCLYGRFHGHAALGSRIDQTSCSLVYSLEQSMKNLVARFVKDESGATAIEYGLIAAGIALAIITVVNNLGTSLNSKFGSISSSLK
jgi:pilus assembly protein Flp/PilA